MLALPTAVLATLHVGPTLGATLSILSFLAIGCVLPTLLVVSLVRRGRASTLDLRERSDRVLPPATTAMGCACAALFLTQTGAPRGVINLALAISMQMALLALITTRWKVSYHTASASALVLVSRLAAPGGVLPRLLDDDWGYWRHT